LSERQDAEAIVPITPNAVERIAVQMNLVPGILLDLLGTQAFRAVCAAVELELFEAVATGPLEVTQVAQRVNASERGVRLLLEALEPLGYVSRHGDRFAATPMTEKWLLGRSPANLARAIPFFRSMVFDRWGNLAEAIRRGEPVVNGYTWLDQHPNQWAAYEEAMLAIARAAAPEIVSRTRLPPSARRLLDLGGGHGYYAVEFCRRHTNLLATIFDLRPALETARQTIAQERMEPRISTLEGDLQSDDLGGPYDVALVFNILHGFEAGRNADLLRRISRNINIGGMVVLLEQTGDRTGRGVGRALARLQALNFFNDLGTRTYTTDEIRGWLTAAGLSDCKRQRLRRLPGFTLLSASRKAAGGR
jgi:cyclopropane fatty-acyl-phospholipid synthase-like methyltransferase